MKLSVKNLAIIVMGLVLPVLVWAVPAIPHQFYGTVNFTSGSAPDGLLVEAKLVDGVSVGSAITKDGKYGYDPLFKAYDNSGTLAGKTISFYVAGINTGETAIFSNGDSTNLNLTVPGSIGTINKSAGDTITNQEIIVTSSSLTTVNMGSSMNVTVSSNTTTSANIEKIEQLGSSYYAGATAVIAGNNILNGYEIKISGSGLTITVTMNYSDTGIDENTIKPYYFNGTTWVEITPFTIDKTANTVTFTISAAATPYSIFGNPLVQSSGGGGGTTGGGGGGGTTTPTPQVASASIIKGDANNDQKVDILDFNILMINWGKTGSGIAGDFNSDGKIDIFDFNLLMINWTK